MISRYDNTLAEKQAATKATAGSPIAWTHGPNPFKDWCAQWFGPDSDDDYLAKAVFNLPPMAQVFKEVAPQQKPVGEVQHLHELNDSWLNKLPVGTKLYTAPQPTSVSSDTLYMLRRLLSNQHTLTGPEFRAELEKIVGEVYQQGAQEPVWDGKLSDAMRNALDALYLQCGHEIARDISHQVRKECEAIYTSYTTAKRMYQAARDRLGAIETAQPQPDPFAAPQPAPDAPFRIFLVTQHHSKEGKLQPRYGSSLFKVLSAHGTFDTAERAREDAENAYHALYPGYKQDGVQPFYSWVVQEMAVVPTSAALAAQGENT